MQAFETPPGSSATSQQNVAAGDARHGTVVLRAIVAATPECIKIVAPDGALIQSGSALEVSEVGGGEIGFHFISFQPHRNPCSFVPLTGRHWARGVLWPRIWAKKISSVMFFGLKSLQQMAP
jgi:hypothetical protein